MMLARDRLIVALDVPSRDTAEDLIDTLGDAVSVYKIGLELMMAGGLGLADILIARGHKVFLDAKFLDIGNTVERATANVARLGASFLTIHGVDRKTMDAAVRGRGSGHTKLLAVTVLTSLDEADLMEQGIQMASEQLVLHRARLAAEAGLDGVIASGHEARKIRETFGPDFLIVTPGIRPAGEDVDDQARVMTPARAIEAGADYLVVGRPITQAADPRAAAEAFIAEIG